MISSQLAVRKSSTSACPVYFFDTMASKDRLFQLSFPALGGLSKKKPSVPIPRWVSSSPPAGAPHFENGDSREIMQVEVYGREVIVAYEGLSGKLEYTSFDYSELSVIVHGIIPHDIQNKVNKLL